MAGMTLLESVRNAAHQIRHSSSNKADPDNGHSSNSRTSESDNDDFEHIDHEHGSADSGRSVISDDARTGRRSSDRFYADTNNSQGSDKSLTPRAIKQDNIKKGRSGSTSLKIDDFSLLKTLGTGTFARVWLTKFKKPDGDARKGVFALKVLRKADVIQLKQVEHVQNERTTLAAVAGHPFITDMILTFMDRDNVYMLLDYCPGGEIFTYLRRAKKFEEPTAKFYAAEVAMIFEYLHDKEGIIYRDLKPENLLIDARGHVKLVDFGFAKKLGKQETYTLCGTPEYLAPEVIKNTGHGVGTDWWALGILIYEFLVGSPPFWDSNPMQIYTKILEEKLRFPSSSKLSEDSKDIITGLLQPQISRRLGCIEGGSQKVKDHPWFACVDWDMLYSKRMDGPIIPKIANDEDAGNFDEYPDEDSQHRREYTSKWRKQYDSAFDGF